MFSSGFAGLFETFIAAVGPLDSTAEVGGQLRVYIIRFSISRRFHSGTATVWEGVSVSESGRDFREVERRERRLFVEQASSLPVLQEEIVAFPSVGAEGSFLLLKVEVDTFF